VSGMLNKLFLSCYCNKAAVLNQTNLLYLNYIVLLGIRQYVFVKGLINICFYYNEFTTIL